jgi:hypothetical protein
VRVYRHSFFDDDVLDVVLSQLSGQRQPDARATDDQDLGIEMHPHTLLRDESPLHDNRDG